MQIRAVFKEHRYVIILLLFFSFFTTASSDYNDASSSIFTNEDISSFSGAFAPLISLSSSPFIALTILSGAGSLLNSGAINSENIPYSQMLTQLPISTTGVFIFFLLITLAKFLLSLLGPAKVFSDATLGKLENCVGIITSIGGTFILSSITTVYAAETAGLGLGGNSLGSYILTHVISFFLSVLAYVVYIVIKTMILAIDILAFLFSPIPGSNAVFTITKHTIIGFYTWYTLVNPIVASIIGLVCLIIAFLVFRAARRLELYYRKIYIIPFFNALFRRDFTVPLVPKKLPYGVAKEFLSNIDICIECFFMNKVSKFYKRELCYFVRSEGKNYLFKKRFLGKTIKIEITGDVYIEKCFRFIRIFTDEGLNMNSRNVCLVLRREHSKNKIELSEKAELIDYNFYLEERRREKAAEIAEKARLMKEKAAEKISATGKSVQNALGGFLKKKKLV